FTLCNSVVKWVLLQLLSFGLKRPGKTPGFFVSGRRMKRRIFNTCLVGGILCWIQPTVLRAWGVVGHKTVAFIAQDYLTPPAKSAVRKILGSGQSLESVASWADSIIRKRPQTAPWHYLNLEVRQPENEFDLSYSCRNHDCVVDQIDKDL